MSPEAGLKSVEILCLLNPENGWKSVEHLCLMNPEKDLKSGLPQSSTAGSPHPGELWCVDGFGTGEALEKIHFGGIGQLERGVAD